MLLLILKVFSRETIDITFTYIQRVVLIRKKQYILKLSNEIE
jgi:hypothetical protein